VLREEFEKRNKNSDKKIFSLSDLTDILMIERRKLMIKLKKYSIAMEPMNYVKAKDKLTEKVEFLSILTPEKINENIASLSLSLQNSFLKAMQKKVDEAGTKKEFIDLIYHLRYYKMIPMSHVHDALRLVEKNLVTKACNQKVLTILSNDINLNYEFIANLLDSKIIDLDEAFIVFKKKNGKTILNVYEDNNIELSIEYDYTDDLSVKYGKKIKIFI